LGEIRKLAAILCSDVVGYSRLAGADEDRILARLRALRSDLIDPTIAVHKGRIVKRTGDGSIIEFRSVVDAVRCAIEVQNAMIERNAGVAADRRIAFRIGIHLGDVVEESDGDLMGDGVNIAARLEGIAEPGAICLSEDAYRQVSGRLDMEVTDLGAKQLKNIARPIRAYSLQVGVPAQAKPPTKSRPPGAKNRSILVPLAAGIVALVVIVGGTWYFLNGNRSASVATNAPASRLSIVVLPFANLSNDPSQDYFADGITENLTTDLSGLSGSLVIARNTAFTLKGRNVDASKIGKELGVRYVLEGSVQRDQSNVRVNSQLIDTESGRQLWAERFDKPLGDLFSMQDEIVASLASQLGAQLVVNEARRAEREPTPDSVDLTFRGMAAFNKGLTPQILEEAHGFFERALALDSNNLDALINMAAVDATAASYYMSENRAARLAAVEAALTKALSLAPNNSSAHYWMGFLLINTNRGSEGIAECERALALNPNMAAAHARIGFAKIVYGRAEETEGHVRDALRLSPRDTSAYVWIAFIAYAKLFPGTDEEAVAWYHRSLDVNRNYAIAHFYLAATLALLGRLDEGRAEAQAGITLDPKFTIQRLRAGALSDNPIYLKQRERIIEGLRNVGIPEG
jgi:TolB-like protein/class 3 adenylate cyclase